MTANLAPVTGASGLAALHTNPELIDYFSRNSNRIAALRTMLDLFGIEYPRWACRNPSGRAARHKDMVAAFKSDNPNARFDR